MGYNLYKEYIDDGIRQLKSYINVAAKGAVRGLSTIIKKEA
ncbi:40423_t:CDS:1, partial [Gigaspora margarita]